MNASEIKRSGFSLVELSIVLIIMAIVGAIAAPKFSRFLESTRLESSMRRVLADLALVRRQAIVSGQSRHMTFQNEQNQYRLVEITSSNRSTAIYEVDLGKDPYNVTMQAGEDSADEDSADEDSADEDSANEVQIRFNSFGLADRDLVITLSTPHFSQVIEVQAETGLARAR